MSLLSPQGYQLKPARVSVILCKFTSACVHQGLLAKGTIYKKEYICKNEHFYHTYNCLIIVGGSTCGTSNLLFLTLKPLFSQKLFKRIIEDQEKKNRKVRF